MLSDNENIQINIKYSEEEIKDRQILNEKNIDKYSYQNEQEYAEKLLDEAYYLLQHQQFI